MLQNKNTLTNCIVGLILHLLLTGCASDRSFSGNTKDPNMITNPNDAAKVGYSNLLKKVNKLYANNSINRKIRIEGIQSAQKLEDISKSGNKYRDNELALTLKPTKNEIDYWKLWFELNNKFIEWDYIEGEIKINYLYKDSILYTGSR